MYQTGRRDLLTVVHLDHNVFRMAHTSTAGAVAAVVKEAMTRADVSVRGMADAAQIPYSTLTRRLSGQFSAFTTSELVAVATVLGTKASAIMRTAEKTAA
jgi:hypothetical protein